MAKLTTTRVAERAGVSVGTLYQYFPNKRALLHALLKEKLDSVASAMEEAAQALHGATLQDMTEALASAFVAAKFREPDVSVALYQASDDLEGKRLARESQARVLDTLAELFGSTCDRTIHEPRRVATLLFSAMAGVSRNLLEQGATRKDMPALERDLAVLMQAYLEASSVPRKDAGGHLGA